MTQGADVPVPDCKKFQGIYSPLFMVLKKNGSWRPVIDLTYLIRKEKSKMETRFTI